MSRRRILVADDDANIREILVMLVKQFEHGQDYEVVTAANGPDALQAVVRDRPDLVLLDNDMPGMTGLDVLTQIHRIDRDIRVYIRIKTTLAVATAAFAYTVMAWVGVDFAAFWAVMVFFFYYIPTVGSILAIAAPAVLALVQFDHLTPFLIVLLVFGTIRIVTANVIEPTIMGRTLNLSPLVVIVSLVVWGTIWGVVGMFLCVPIMVVALIVLAQFETTRPLAVLLSADGRIPEPQGEAA